MNINTISALGGAVCSPSGSPCNSLDCCVQDFDICLKLQRLIAINAPVEVELQGFVSRGGFQYCTTGCESLNRAYILQVQSKLSPFCDAETNKLPVSYLCNGAAQSLTLQVLFGCISGSFVSVALKGVGDYIFFNNYGWGVTGEAQLEQFVDGQVITMVANQGNNTCGGGDVTASVRVIVP